MLVADLPRTDVCLCLVRKPWAVEAAEEAKGSPCPWTELVVRRCSIA